MSRSSQFPIQAPRAPARSARHAQLTRLAETSRAPVTFYLDGEPVQALAGDTLLTAILTHQRHVRFSEFSGTPRAGFCLIGACQDCWVRCETVSDGHGERQLTRLRACSTIVQPGMRIVTLATDAIDAIDAIDATHIALAPGGSHD